MKIKHKNLEAIKANPRMASALVKENSNGKSMVRYWDWAVSCFHHKKSLRAALNYLENGILSFNDTKQNRTKGNKLLEALEVYTKSYDSLGFNYLSSQKRIKIDIEHNNFITGEIFRLDETVEGGYAITILQRQDDVWAHELRFKVLQVYFSNYYKCPFDLIKVGVYNVEKGIHEYISFDENELNEAWNEVIELSKEINKFII